MEILNNLWNLITTPNEMIINIILIFAIFIENTLILLLFTSISNIKPKRKDNIIYVCIMSAVALITMFFIPAPFNSIINLFVPFIAAYFIFKNGIFKTILTMVITLFASNLVVVLLLNPYLAILNITSEALSTIPIYRFFYLVVIYSVLAILIFLIKNQQLYLEIAEYIDKKNKLIITSNLLFGVLAIALQTIILTFYIDSLPILITFISFLSLFIYFALSVYSMTRVLKLAFTTKRLESVEEYNNTLRILHDNVRGFKHDFDNIVTTIGGYIRTDDMEGLKKYYFQLEGDCQSVNNLYILNPDIVNNDGIYNLLTKKYYAAEAKDIKINITFLLDLSKLNMKIYEFARILGILLDNAIEASAECEEKIINIIFRDDVKNSRQLIIIENTYANKDVDTEKIFEKGISEKENHTGLGLWEVRKILKKSNNANLYTSKTDNYFSQQLEIYYKKDSSLPAKELQLI